MLNERIKELRLAKNLSQVQLAEDLGVSKQCVSNWENDNVQPSIDMLVRIARYFNVTTDYLLGLTQKRALDVGNLNSVQIAHIAWLIDELAKN